METTATVTRDRHPKHFARTFIVRENATSQNGPQQYDKHALNKGQFVFAPFPKNIKTLYFRRWIDILFFFALTETKMRTIECIARMQLIWTGCENLRKETNARKTNDDCETRNGWPIATIANLQNKTSRCPSLFERKLNVWPKQCFGTNCRHDNPCWWCQHVTMPSLQTLSLESVSNRHLWNWMWVLNFGEL